MKLLKLTVNKLNMSYHKSGRKFHRKRNQRNALIRSLALALITKGRIKTTESKAKELRPWIERLITKSKIPSVPHKRLTMKHIKNKKAVQKLFGELGPKYMDRAGGYTRITKLGHRPSDGSKIAMIEFV